MFKNRKKIIISVCITAIAAAAVFTCFYIIPRANENNKTITITVNHLNKDNKTLKINTKAKYLGEALKKCGLMEGSEKGSGFVISSIDGEKASENEKQWWGFTKSGEYVDTSIDKTPFANGDSFEFSLHAG